MKRWKHLGGPLKVGLIAALIGIVLALIGIARGAVPANAYSIVIALVISGGSWGIVAWAIASAAFDVEQDVAEAEQGDAEIDQPATAVTGNP